MAEIVISKLLKEAQARRKGLDKLNERVKAAAFSKKYENFDEIVPVTDVVTVVNQSKSAILEYIKVKQQIAVANTTIELDNGMSLLEGMSYVGYLKQIMEALKDICNAPDAEMVSEGYGRQMYMRKTVFNKTDVNTLLKDLSNEYSALSVMIDKANVLPH
jgi:hypothetical protein